MHRITWRPPVAALLLLTLTLTLTSTVTDADAVRPLERQRSAADPSVARTTDGQYVALSTGPRVHRMVSANGVRWRRIAPALLSRPSWARRDSTVWAADMVRLRHRWVLYYAAPVRGMGDTSRCIGVAVSARGTGRFRPVGHRPLVCPPQARTPRAEDRVLDRRGRPTYPTIGAIDPSVFVDGRRVHLLYKTDGRPSSIRLLRLTAGGLHARGRSRSLLATHGVLENPVMVRRGGWLYLLMSAGDYRGCGYSTVWRRSRSLTRWRGRRQHTLLARRGTGLCGPGGADVVDAGAAVRLYFHGWTCHRSSRPCPGGFRSTGIRERRPVRALYGASLRFTPRRVSVSRYLAPAVPDHTHRPRRARPRPDRAARHRRQHSHRRHAHHRRHADGPRRHHVPGRR